MKTINTFLNPHKIVYDFELDRQRYAVMEIDKQFSIWLQTGLNTWRRETENFPAMNPALREFFEVFILNIDPLF